MLTDRTRLTLTAVTYPMVTRYVTWGEFRKVHGVTMTAEELASIAVRIQRLNGYSMIQGAAAIVVAPPLVMVRVERKAE